MRHIILDTETTGLNPRSGNRIIEIGCVEMLNRQITVNNFHRYLNPGRDSEEGALAVHGLTTEFLSDKPTFADIAAEFLDYIAGAEIIIHNAPFDMGFLDMELSLLGHPEFTKHVVNVIDTLPMAKKMHPGKRNSLDALCARYGISNAHRTLHSGLLDAALLAEVYLAMTRGQNSLSMDLGMDDAQDTLGNMAVLAPLGEIIVRTANAEELALHEANLTGLDKDSKGKTIWRALEECVSSG